MACCFRGEAANERVDLGNEWGVPEPGPRARGRQKEVPGAPKLGRWLTGGWARRGTGKNSKSARAGTPPPVSESQKKRGKKRGRERGRKKHADGGFPPASAGRLLLGSEGGLADGGAPPVSAGEEAFGLLMCDGA